MLLQVIKLIFVLSQKISESVGGMETRVASLVVECIMRLPDLAQARNSELSLSGDVCGVSNFCYSSPLSTSTNQVVAHRFEVTEVMACIGTTYFLFTPTLLRRQHYRPILPITYIPVQFTEPRSKAIFVLGGMAKIIVFAKCVLMVH